MRDVTLLIMMALLAGMTSCAEELEEREKTTTESLGLEGEESAVDTANQKNQEFLDQFALAVAESPKLGAAMQTASSQKAPGLQVGTAVLKSEDEGMCREGSPNSGTDAVSKVAMVETGHASSISLRERVLHMRGSDFGPAQVAPSIESLEGGGQEGDDVKFGPFTY